MRHFLLLFFYGDEAVHSADGRIFSLLPLLLRLLRDVVHDWTGESDLWWAIRGAGPAFGIMTRYKVRAFPVPVVFAGNLL